MFSTSPKNERYPQILLLSLVRFLYIVVQSSSVWVA
ncbi:hypothetical protein HU200_040654 [Digitaria exilis]|uniref:Uncharacterized protein n=1 Tax=Digitaria exilis TaxID=1010633 RepID=A0A835EGN1_9POAL|nr:hypothetical protein HU200_040654 [Digitaria exilis]